MSEIEFKSFKNPTFLVITKEGTISFVLSMVVLLYSAFNYSIDNLAFMLPALIIPVLFLIFMIRIFTTRNLEMDIQVSIPNTEIKAKSFLPVSVLIESEYPVKSMLTLDTSHGLFNVVNSKSILISTEIQKGTTFMFYAAKRGDEEIKKLTVNSLGVFGLFTLEQRIVIQRKITVLPEPQRVELPWNLKQKIMLSLISQLAIPVRGRGYDFFALRDYQYGDEIRHIHWRKSAKINSLVVKEFEEHEMLRFLIVVDITMLMVGAKLEFILSAVMEIATALRRSHHSLVILLHGDNYSKIINFRQSTNAMSVLGIELHAVKAEGVEFNFNTLKKTIVEKKLKNSVMLLLTSTEINNDALRAGIPVIKRDMQALFMFAAHTPGFGTLSLSKIRETSFVNQHQMNYRREIIEASLERIYEQKIIEYRKIVNSHNSQLRVVRTYNTNILLEIRALLILYGKKAGRQISGGIMNA